MQIAIITARGGSKRIPRKNIRPFNGKPMIAWSIEVALQSGCFTHVFVSTEDEEIADIATRFGAVVPYLRPANMADDITHAHVPAREMLEWALRQYGDIPAFCHIYPTAPFLAAETIRQGEQAIRAGAPNAYAMQKTPFPIYQALVMREEGLQSLFGKELASMRSQDMPVAYYGAGQMYWFNTAYFLEHETAICPQTVPIEVPRERCVDIDNEEDWLFAEKMAQFLSE